jgi:hypothetical protein
MGLGQRYVACLVYGAAARSRRPLQTRSLLRPALITFPTRHGGRTLTTANEKPEKSGSDAPEQPQGSSFTCQNADGPAFFGVFDGHGGSAVARFTGTTIHSRLAALDAYSELFGFGGLNVRLIVMPSSNRGRKVRRGVEDSVSEDGRGSPCR